MKPVIPRPVLLLGDPRLRINASPVADVSDSVFLSEAEELHERLTLFRQGNGFGRAIAAPQIGIAKRFISLNLDGVRSTLVNPVISWASRERFSMWDDCMSFPNILVRLERHCSVSVVGIDERGRHVQHEKLPRDLSELLQHEIDHLDGILALDRAIDKESIIERNAFNSMPEHFRKQVDYVIRSYKILP